MNKEFIRKFSLICDWYSEADYLSLDDKIVFKMNIQAIEDTLEEQEGSNKPTLYDEKLKHFLDTINFIGREFHDWPLVRGE